LGAPAAWPTAQRRRLPVGAVPPPRLAGGGCGSSSACARSSAPAAAPAPRCGFRSPPTGQRGQRPARFSRLGVVALVASLPCVALRRAFDLVLPRVWLTRFPARRALLCSSEVRTWDARPPFGPTALPCRARGGALAARRFATAPPRRPCRVSCGANRTAENSLVVDSRRVVGRCSLLGRPRSPHNIATPCPLPRGRTRGSSVPHHPKRQARCRWGPSASGTPPHGRGQHHAGGVGGRRARLSRAVLTSGAQLPIAMIAMTTQRRQSPPPPRRRRHRHEHRPALPPPLHPPPPPSLHGEASTEGDAIPARVTEQAGNKRDSVQLMFGCAALDRGIVPETGGTHELDDLNPGYDDSEAMR